MRPYGTALALAALTIVSLSVFLHPSDSPGAAELRAASMQTSPGPREPARESEAGQQQDEIQDLVFVTEDDAHVDTPGCDAISVFDSRNGEVLYRAKGRVSPARLAVALREDGILAFASQGNGAIPFLHFVRRDSDGRWSAGVAENTRAATLSGVGFTGDGDDLLVAESGKGSAGTLVNRPPFLLSRVPAPSQVGQTMRIQGATQRKTLDQVAVEILVPRSGERIHVVTADAQLKTFEGDTFEESAPAISFEPMNAQNKVHDEPIDRLHADMSEDGRYVFIGLGYSGAIAILDTIDRIATTLVLEPAVRYVGGVAVNRGWENEGLIAAHHIDAVAVYAFAAPDRISLVSSLPVAAPQDADRLDTATGTVGPKMSLSWSGNGDRVIAATNHQRRYEFVVLDFSETEGLTERHFIEVCPHNYNAPNGIVTLNGLLRPPATATATPAPTASPTPTALDTPTPSPSPSASPSPTPSHTATSTATASVTPRPPDLFIPLVLREACANELRRVDVVIVLDSSSSMSEPTSAGRSKLDAAVEAALALLDALDFMAGDQAALVVFNEDVTSSSPLTSRPADLEAALEDASAAPGTCIPCGLAEAERLLFGQAHRESNTPALVLLTDGRSNVQPIADALPIAEAMKARGATLFTIGLGHDVEEDQLRQIASGAARYFNTSDAETLVTIFESIIVEIPCGAGDFWGRR